MLNTIVNPIFDNSVEPYKKYAGNYSKMHKDDGELNETIKSNLLNFHEKYSSQKYNTSAWNTSLIDVHSYLESQTLYDDLPNKGIIEKVWKEGENIDGELVTGKRRFKYITYPDPVHFACQQSHILYFPVEVSKGDDVYIWDKMMKYKDKDGFSKDFYPFTPTMAGYYLSSNGLIDPRKYSSFEAYKEAVKPNHSSSILGLMLGMHVVSNYRDSKEKLSKQDLHGNHYINTNGHLVYEPAKFGISAIYAGPAISIPYAQNFLGETLWNEIHPNDGNWSSLRFDGEIAHPDHLANFINTYFRSNVGDAKKFRDIENGTVGNTENGSAIPGALRENSVYLRSNKNQNSTLMGVYLRTKDWMNRMILQNRNDGRIFSDQYGYEGFAKDITYTVTYNPQLWTSNIIIYEPRIAPNAGRSGHIANHMTDPQHQTLYTIKYDQGDFFTSSEDDAEEQMLTPEYLGGGVTDEDVQWLKGKLDLGHLKYRNRNTPLGDIVNSSIKYAARDHFYINLDLVGNRALYADYMRKKSDHFQQNLLIAGSNDGFVNFIVAARNSKNQEGVSEVGQRKASYFVPFFKSDLRAIMQGWEFDPSNNEYVNKFQHKYRVDGHINLMDGIVDKEFKTIGISMMGAGYRGLVGFQIFSINDTGNEIDNKIQPLFTISNKTQGFEKLGNTFSEVSFFNEGEGKSARIVGVFGNSGLFGDQEHEKSRSVIYFINAVTGAKIGEIDVSLLANDKDTKGAGSPALVLSANDEQGQNLDMIYFGDRSGRLYRIDLSIASGFTLEEKITNISDSIKNEALAKTSNTVKVIFHYDIDVSNELNAKAIMHKPFIKKGIKSNEIWAYFGTGWRVTDKDIKDPKNKDIKEQYLVAVKDILGEKREPLTLSHLKKSRMSLHPNNTTYSYVNGGGRQELLISSAGLNSNDLGWYVTAGVPFLPNMLTDTTIERFELPALLTGSPAMISNSAEPYGDFVIFSSRGLVRYPINDGSSIYPEFKNYCMPDLVQSHVATLAAFTGDRSLPSDSHYLNDRATKRQGNIVVPQLGVVAPFRSYGLLQADSKLGNLDNGFNFSLSAEERRYLDKDATPVENSYRHYTLGINGSSSNIGGRNELGKNALSYTDKYQANQVPMANGVPSYVFELPHSSYFGVEGMFRGNTVGATPVPPEIKLHSKRLSLRKRF